MNKKIAIAIDGTRNSKEALDYAVVLNQHISNLTFTLLHIQASISLYLVEEAERDFKARQTLEKVIKANQASATEILEQTRDHLIKKGIEIGNIQLKTYPRLVGVADDILTHSRQASFDAILLAKRGLTKVQEWMTGSVTTNLVEHSRLTPIWVVNGKVPSPDILLAVDGSQSALRALDHVCFILKDTKKTHLNIIHVQPKFSDYCSIDITQEAAENAQDIILSGHHHCIDNFFSQAQAMIQDHGISMDHVTFQTHPKRMSITQTIFEEFDKGGFGTIVLGRRGISPSLFTGSVSRKILQKISNQAVWIVP